MDNHKQTTVWGTLQWANRQQQSSLVMVAARSSHGGSLSTPWCIKNHDKDGKNNVKGIDQLTMIMERHWQHHGTVQWMVTAAAAYGRRGKQQNVRWDWLSNTATQHSMQWQCHRKRLGQNCETMSARQLGNTMAQHSDQCNVCQATSNRRKQEKLTVESTSSIPTCTAVSSDGGHSKSGQWTLPAESVIEVHLWTSEQSLGSWQQNRDTNRCCWGILSDKNLGWLP